MRKRCKKRHNGKSQEDGAYEEGRIMRPKSYKDHLTTCFSCKHCQVHYIHHYGDNLYLCLKDEEFKEFIVEKDFDKDIKKYEEYLNARVVSQKGNCIEHEWYRDDD